MNPNTLAAALETLAREAQRAQSETRPHDRDVPVVKVSFATLQTCGPLPTLLSEVAEALNRRPNVQALVFKGNGDLEIGCQVSDAAPEKVGLEDALEKIPFMGVIKGHHRA